MGFTERNIASWATSLVTSDSSIEAALEPVKLFEGIGKGGCDVGSRFTVHTLYLDQPGTSGGIP